MSHQITFQPMRVLIDGHDSDGRLILADDQLTAVIVPLDAQHHTSDLRGRWHLEAGFGPYAIPPGNAPVWATPDDAAAWVRERLAGPAYTRRDKAVYGATRLDPEAAERGRLWGQCWYEDGQS